MKKILFITVMCLMIMGCTSNNENSISYKPKPFKKYEVLLPTKDTIYVDAYTYQTWDNSGMFSAGNTIVYTFYDDRYSTLIEIKNPVYVKEIR